MAGAYPDFSSTKQLRVLLLPPGWDASPSQGYPQQYVTGTHFKHLGGERQCGVKYLVQGNNTMVGTESEVKLLLLLKNSCIISGMGREWDDRMCG